MAGERGEITSQSLEDMVGREGSPQAQLQARVAENNTKMKLDLQKQSELRDALYDALPSADDSIGKVNAFEEATETMERFKDDSLWIGYLYKAGVLPETIIKVWDTKKAELEKLRSQRTTDQDKQE